MSQELTEQMRQITEQIADVEREWQRARESRDLTRALSLAEQHQKLVVALGAAGEASLKYRSC